VQIEILTQFDRELFRVCFGSCRSQTLPRSTRSESSLSLQKTGKQMPQAATKFQGMVQ